MTEPPPHGQAQRRSFVVRGGVERGDQRGRTLGFPTANVAVEDASALDGVWAGWVELDGVRHGAAISVGNRSTFYGRSGYRLLEAHILDFDRDIYDRMVTVWARSFLREQFRFGTVDLLVEQLHRDVEAAGAWFAGAGAEVLPEVRALVELPLGRSIAVTP